MDPPGSSIPEEFPRVIGISETEVEEAAGLVAAFGDYKAEVQQRVSSSGPQKVMTDTDPSQRGWRRLTSSGARVPILDGPFDPRRLQLAETISSGNTRTEATPPSTLRPALPNVSLPAPAHSPPSSPTARALDPLIPLTTSQSSETSTVDREEHADVNPPSPRWSTSPSTSTINFPTPSNIDSPSPSINGSAPRDNDSPSSTPSHTTVSFPLRRTTRGWELATEAALEESVRHMIENEDGRNMPVFQMWDRVAERMNNFHGFTKTAGACRMLWNRRLRAETGFDERQTPNQNLTTSAQ
ncbi:hypothetical protein IWZ01DRAFT_486697 [Phyllosticta capitalensis]